MLKAILTTEQAAVKLQSIVAEDCGYPLDGVDVGGGIHAPPEVTRTLYLDHVQKHPKKDEWATAVGSVDVAAKKDSIKAKRGMSDAQIDALDVAAKSAKELPDDWTDAKAENAEEKP
jgi:hypothetical protein